MEHPKGLERRTRTAIDGDQLAGAIGRTLGREARLTRRRRRTRQQDVADAVGISRSRYADLERGEGSTASLVLWARVGAALGRPLAVSLSRDVTESEPRDAGHLAAQETLLRLARATGRRASFELATRPADPSRSTDVGLRDDRYRLLILAEIHNRLDDLGAAARASDRKHAEVESGHALLAGGDGPPYDVASCWLLVDTAANRALVRRYPEVFRSRFPGSSRAWARALVTGERPPTESGVVWIDPRAGRISPLRLRAG